MKYYIIERDNPQLSKPYYIAVGKISKAKAKKLENCKHGINMALEYETEDDYTKAIQGLMAEGYTVNDSLI